MQQHALARGLGGDLPEESGEGPHDRELPLGPDPAVTSDYQRAHNGPTQKLYRLNEYSPFSIAEGPRERAQWLLPGELALDAFADQAKSCTGRRSHDGLDVEARDWPVGVGDDGDDLSPRGDVMEGLDDETCLAADLYSVWIVGVSHGRTAFRVKCG